MKPALKVLVSASRQLSASLSFSLSLSLFKTKASSRAFFGEKRENFGRRAMASGGKFGRCSLGISKHETRARLLSQVSQISISAEDVRVKGSKAGEVCPRARRLIASLICTCRENENREKKKPRASSSSSTPPPPPRFVAPTLTDSYLIFLLQRKSGIRMARVDSPTTSVSQSFSSFHSRTRFDSLRLASSARSLPPRNPITRSDTSRLDPSFHPLSFVNSMPLRHFYPRRFLRTLDGLFANTKKSIRRIFSNVCAAGVFAISGFETNAKFVNLAI